MIPLGDWLVRRREYLVFLVSVVISLILMFSNNGPHVRFMKIAAFGGFGYVLDKVVVLKQYFAVYDENQILRKRNAELMLENSALREAWVENRRLKKMLDFKQSSEFELIPAKVIGKDANGFINSLFLNVGAAEGLRKNMTVVTPEGLAGRIYDVTNRHSTAQLLLDRNFRASAMVQRSRIPGIVKWMEGHRVVLAEVARRSDVKVGDKVVTSGWSTIYPGGIEIGNVAEVRTNENSVFMEVTIIPSVDFTLMEEVFVLSTIETGEN